MWKYIYNYIIYIKKIYYYKTYVFKWNHHSSFPILTNTRFSETNAKVQKPNNTRPCPLGGTLGNNLCLSIFNIYIEYGYTINVNTVVSI